ncbi:hypothetical protein [Verrucomicrobium spinosum]|uniref:hypothetical protein n=1 Tax=Verrucomicrobium spinosum TaxID=2736 RepID=UPI00094687B1|nr:hypothetical protein [Verrucomicrobium spinosum]
MDGLLFCEGGQAWFGPKSLFEETPGVLQEASQGYPSLMKNHTVFSYVDLPSTRYFDGNRVTYRAGGHEAEWEHRFHPLRDWRRDERL